MIELMEHARYEAERMGHRRFEQHHLLLAVTAHHPESVARVYGLPAEEVRKNLLLHVPPGWGLIPELANFSDGMNDLLRSMPTLATELGDEEIDIDHLLLGLALAPILSESVRRTWRALDLDVEAPWANARAARGAENGKRTPNLIRSRMFDGFADGARRSVVLAMESAQDRDHDYIGTEHLLLGVLAADNRAHDVLERLGASISDMRAKVDSKIGRGKGSPPDHVPFTPRAKAVLELACFEARLLGHGEITSEHLLLGMLNEGDGVAAIVLRGVGIHLDETRRIVAELWDRHRPMA